MSSPSFLVYPRRAVATPDGGSALVSVRTNVELDGRGVGPGAPTNLLRRMARAIKGDKTWRVEVYDNQQEDRSSLPPEYPHRVLVVPDRETAAVVAEQVCSVLTTQGLDAIPGIPQYDSWIEQKLKRP